MVRRRDVVWLVLVCLSVSVAFGLASCSKKEADEEAAPEAEEVSTEKEKGPEKPPEEPGPEKKEAPEEEKTPEEEPGEKPEEKTEKGPEQAEPVFRKPAPPREIEREPFNPELALTVHEATDADWFWRSPIKVGATGRKKGPVPVRADGRWFVAAAGDVSDKTLPALVDALAKLDVKALSLRGSKKLTDKGLASLAKLSSLRRLSLAHTGISGKGLAD
ncbi:MAG: hypothetical protein R6V58_10115, partial [Planctomycetota bacterium]